MEPPIPKPFRFGFCTSGSDLLAEKVRLVSLRDRIKASGMYFDFPFVVNNTIPCARPLFRWIPKWHDGHLPIRESRRSRQTKGDSCSIWSPREDHSIRIVDQICWISYCWTHAKAPHRDIRLSILTLTHRSAPFTISLAIEHDCSPFFLVLRICFLKNWTIGQNALNSHPHPEICSVTISFAIEHDCSPFFLVLRIYFRSVFRETFQFSSDSSAEDMFGPKCGSICTGSPTEKTYDRCCNSSFTDS
jgi:hypothetical protein